MSNMNDGTIGGLPKNINKEVSTPKLDANTITKLVKENGKVVGYELSNGEQVSKEEGISLAKQGCIAGVAIATRNDEEYLRTLPDDNESNNLSDLPTVKE